MFSSDIERARSKHASFDRVLNAFEVLHLAALRKKAETRFVVSEFFDGVRAHLQRLAGKSSTAPSPVQSYREMGESLARAVDHIDERVRIVEQASATPAALPAGRHVSEFVAPPPLKIGRN
jgi:hypothetical protein